MKEWPPKIQINSSNHSSNSICDSYQRKLKCKTPSLFLLKTFLTEELACILNSVSFCCVIKEREEVYNSWLCSWVNRLRKEIHWSIDPREKMVVVIKTCLAKKMNSVSSTDMRTLPPFFFFNFLIRSGWRAWVSLLVATTQRNSWHNHRT